ncbi:hypothetical protein I5N59_25130 [Serratia marcescens]|uniref:hypothetical protein n=1 Tax=Serratia marcescens TaxID=615 RepID=UPI0018D83BCE|nr:hypothetical protein [Serratia marcescens]
MWNIHPTRNTYVLLAQYLSPIDAYIEAALLKSEGIDTLLLDENLVWNIQMTSLAVGGVKLLVERVDAEMSSQIIAKYHNGYYLINDDAKLSEPPSNQVKAKSTQCDYLNIMLVLLLLITTGIALPLPSGRRKG